MVRWQEEIPQEQAAAEAAGQQLEAAESQLESLQDGIKDEVEGYHQQLNKVRGWGHVVLVLTLFGCKVGHAAVSCARLCWCDCLCSCLYAHAHA